jgi:arylsulfatase A-like enzyme
MFTGRWPHELSVSYTAPLDRRYPTLAGYLRDHGYQTAGFVANLKFCSAATGLSRGFDRYEDYPRSLGEIAISSRLTRYVVDTRLRELIANERDRLTRMR